MKGRLNLVELNFYSVQLASHIFTYATKSGGATAPLAVASLAPPIPIPLPCNDRHFCPIQNGGKKITMMIMDFCIESIVGITLAGIPCYQGHAYCQCKR